MQEKSKWIELFDTRANLDYLVRYYPKHDKHANKHYICYIFMDGSGTVSECFDLLCDRDKKLKYLDDFLDVVKNEKIILNNL